LALVPEKPAEGLTEDELRERFNRGASRFSGEEFRAALVELHGTQISAVEKTIRGKKELLYSRSR
jgi:hypothetical protein